MIPRITLSALCLVGLLTVCNAGNLEKDIAPHIAAAAPTPVTQCPNDIASWNKWRDDAVALLVKRRTNASGDTSLDLTQVISQSVPIANFIDDCSAFFSDKAALDASISNLRRFTSNLRNNLSSPSFDHQFGYTIDDFSYLEKVADNIALPPLLRSADFLTAVSSRDTYKAAYDMIQQLNTTLPDTSKWRVFLYKSRFLTTPDNAGTFGRFFVYVPGEAYDKWIQFGIKTPDDTSTIPINNLSIVSVAKPDNQGRRFNAIADWWRTFTSGWTPKLATRRESQGVTENCIMCHKTSPLGIHPVEEYTFDSNGALIVDTTNQGKTPAFLNSLIAGYGAPYFNDWATPGDYGPPLGPNITRSDSFMSACTANLNLPQSSIDKIKANMVCTNCHTDDNVGVLNFPTATRHAKSAGNQIYQYITNGWMPPRRTFTDNEKAGLYQCLMNEYFNFDTGSGLFTDWLRNNTATVHMLVAELVRPAFSGSGSDAFDQTCADCHPKDAGDNDIGPTLFGVVGRKAGSVPGYSYSPSLVEAGNNGLVWSDAELTAFLASPSTYLTSKLGHPATTKMRNGFSDPSLVSAVIGYLDTLH